MLSSLIWLPAVTGIFDKAERRGRPHVCLARLHVVLAALPFNPAHSTSHILPYFAPILLKTILYSCEHSLNCYFIWKTLCLRTQLILWLNTALITRVISPRLPFTVGLISIPKSILFEKHVGMIAIYCITTEAYKAERLVPHRRVCRNTHTYTDMWTSKPTELACCGLRHLARDWPRDARFPLLSTGMRARASTYLPRLSWHFTVKSLHRDQPLKEKRNMTCPPWRVLRSWQDILILTRRQIASFHCLCHLHAVLLKSVHITKDEFTFNLEKNIKVCGGVQSISWACYACSMAYRKTHQLPRVSGGPGEMIDFQEHTAT